MRSESSRQRSANLIELLRARARALPDKQVGVRAIEAVSWPASRPTRPLSFAQQRMWLLQRMEPTSSAYNLPLAVRFRGPLDIPLLAGALSAVARRHEVLRGAITTVNGKARQVIAAPAAVRPLIIDLRRLPSAARALEARHLARQQAARCFDLEAGPLWRSILIAKAEDEHELVVTMHHIVSDGWSMGLWARELAMLYNAPVSDHRIALLPALPIRYADYAVWQRRWLSEEVLASELAYWKAQLAPSAAETGGLVLELPTDRPRAAVKSSRGASVSFALAAALVRDLEASSRAQGVTLFMTLLAAFQVLLGRYSGQPDLAVGTPIAGRTQQETEPLIGLFVNTLVLRTDLSAAPTFAALLEHVKEVTLGAYAHQHLPFEKVVEALAPERDASRTPLFQVMFALQNAPLAMPPVEGLEIALQPLDNGTAKFDLTLSLEAAGDGLAAKLAYNRDLFDGATLERLGRHFRTLLEDVRTGAERRLAELSMSSAAERHQMAVEWNDTATEYEADSCLHQLFAAQARRTPTAAALEFENEVLTYGELNEASNRLAHHLRQLGVATDDIVALCLPRSTALIVAVLGVLKAGGAYLPLEPSDPPDRLRFILSDARPRLLVTAHHLGLEGLLRADDQASRVVCVDRDREVIAARSAAAPGVDVDPENLAYVLYTSGSTGRPKGVSVSHRNAVNYLRWVNDTLFAGRVHRLPMTTRLAFDASLKQVLAPLLRGDAARLLPDAVVAEPGALLAALQAGRFDGLNCIPSLWEALVAMLETERIPTPEGLRCLYVGGEELHEALVARTRSLLPALRIFNLYGPTETTANASYAEVAEEGRPSLGRPLANLRIRILDAHLRPVAIGVIGELCVSGAGVARGYLRRPALTAHSYVPAPYGEEPGARMYRTGDLGRFLPDGTIEYIGRRDDQVKVRGFRIELGEIEAAIAALPAVREVAVLVQEEGRSRRLVACMVSRDGEGEHGENSWTKALRSELEARLPTYMVPTRFLRFPALPRSQNGKLDRTALERAAVAVAATESEMDADSPLTPVQEVLAGMMAEILGLESVGLHDHFFEIGGNSLLAAELVALIQDTFEVELPLLQLFDAATVSELAQCLLEDPLRREKVETTAPLLLQLVAAPEDDAEAQVPEEAQA